tara:strand:+ start:21277 stop:21738 length:462 start_codon:yes stop_codon:yes gene_type:complete
MTKTYNGLTAHKNPCFTALDPWDDEVEFKGVQLFGDYPAAYWGYREAFCNNSIGEIDECSDGDPYKVAVEHLQRFSLAEKIGFGNCFPDNHSTVMMASGIYITFHDGRIFVGDDVRIMDSALGAVTIDGVTKLIAPRWFWNGWEWVNRDPSIK